MLGRELQKKNRVHTGARQAWHPSVNSGDPGPRANFSHVLGPMSRKIPMVSFRSVQHPIRLFCFALDWIAYKGTYNKKITRHLLNCVQSCRLRNLLFLFLSLKWKSLVRFEKDKTEMTQHIHCQFLFVQFVPPLCVRLHLTHSKSWPLIST